MGAKVLLLIVSCLAGMFFGLYYNFLVLIPLTLAAAIVCGASAAWHGQHILELLLLTVILAVGLQGGYMIGLTSRDVLSQLLSRLNALNSRHI
jgi:hypothetical protein